MATGGRTIPSETIQIDLIRRLRSAEGHLRGIIGMVEAGASCQDILLRTALADPGRPCARAD